MQNFIIVGITGVGKTTIGKALAEKLGKTFIDLDKSIEARCGVDIATIFAIEGEASFRNRETRELKDVLNNSNKFVLSLGGGCLTKAENCELILNCKNVKVIQLYADTMVVVERLSKSPNKRPTLINKDLESSVTKMIEERQANYDKVSQFKINTTKLKPLQIVAQIMNICK